jgi:hypothetical protein
MQIAGFQTRFVEITQEDQYFQSLPPNKKIFLIQVRKN